MLSFVTTNLLSLRKRPIFVALDGPHVAHIKGSYDTTRFSTALSHLYSATLMPFRFLILFYSEISVENDIQ